MSISRRVRLAAAVVLLIVSLALLAWGLLPAVRERRTQWLQPGDIQLPTPGAVLPAPGCYCAVPGQVS